MCLENQSNFTLGLSNMPVNWYENPVISGKVNDNGDKINIVRSVNMCSSPSFRAHVFYFCGKLKNKVSNHIG